MAATSFVAAILQAANGFGFAVLAVPLFLLFAEPGPAIQIVIIVTLALSAVVLPGMRSAIDRPLLLRMGIGAAAGLPLGLVAFGYADPVAVRAVIGVIILAFAAVIVGNEHRTTKRLRMCRDAERHEGPHQQQLHSPRCQPRNGRPTVHGLTAPL